MDSGSTHPTFQAVYSPVFEAIYRALGGSAAPAFSPVSLFTGGYTGVWYDPSDLSTLWQDSARTTPVTADGDPVGCIDDKSGNGKHLTQATAGKRPQYKTSSGLHWLEFDGVDDAFASASIDFTVTDKISVFTATKFDGTGNYILCEFSANTTLNNGAFEYLGLAGQPCFYGRGTALYGERTTAITAIHTASCAYDIAQATGALELIPRKDGATFSPRTVDAGTTLGTGNFGNYPLYVGGRAATSLYHNGRVYGLLIVGKACSGLEFTSMDAYHATKAGL